MAPPENTTDPRWWENKLTAEAMLRTAMTDALAEHEKNKINLNPPTTSSPPSFVSSISPAASPAPTPGTPPGTVTSAMATAQALKGPAKAIEIYNESVRKAHHDIEPFLRQYNEIQKAYGGLSIDPEKGIVSKGHSATVVKRLESIQRAYSNADNAGVLLSKNLGQTGNIFNKYFKSDAALFDAQEDVLGRLARQHSKYIKGMSDEAINKVPFYAESMGISSRQVAENIERQINRTGKASTTMLDDIMKFSVGLHENTDLPLKAISANAVRIMNDTRRMGDVTAEESTRMAATLMQLGQSYDSFTSTQDRFQDFSSAAATAAEIAQITSGRVQIDARDISFIASETPEELPAYLKAQFDQAGYGIEELLSVSQSEQNRMYDALGKSAEETANFFSHSINPQDLIDVNARTNADMRDGFSDVMTQQALAAKSDETTEKATDTVRMRSILENQQALILAAENSAKLNETLRNNIELTDSVSVGGTFEDTLKKYSDATNYLNVRLPPGSTIGLSELGKFLQDYASGAAEPVSQPAPPPAPPRPTPSRPIKKPEATPVVVEAQTDIMSVDGIPAGGPGGPPAYESSNNTGFPVLTSKIDELVAVLKDTMNNTSNNNEIVLNLNDQEIGRIMLAGNYSGRRIVTTTRRGAQ